MQPLNLNASADAISQATRAEMTLPELLAAINKAIAQSFREERVRGDVPVVSDRTLRERAEMCWKWFRIMRFDCGYTADRAADFLPLALRKQLDGQAWEPPPKDRAWSPSVLSR